MKVEIITVAEEVTSGHSADNSAILLARKAVSMGGKVSRIVSLGEEVEALAAALREATKRGDLILVTGGLAPYPDDLSSRAAAQSLGRRLVPHRGYLDALKEQCQRWNRTFTPSYERQALLPEGATLLPNPMGICGFRLQEGAKAVFFFPGVAHGLEKMVERFLLPHIREKIHGEKGITRTSRLKVFGLTEVEIRALLQDLEGNFELTYLSSFPETHLQLVVQGADEPEVEARRKKCQEEISKKLGIYLFGKDDDVMEDVVGRFFREKKATLAVAESCTGGLIAHRITEIPGSSEYFLRGIVVYSDQAKEDLLGVPRFILQKFGPVSRETVEHMAKGVRERSGTTLGVATTGIAGPTGGTPDVPVGRVFIGLAAKDTMELKKYDFFGDRHQIKLMASEVALDRMRRFLLKS